MGEPAEHRSAQLMQSSEGELHIWSDTDSADDAEPGRLCDQVLQQCRLAVPRFSPHDEGGS
jgi:hypothetical protein